MSKEKVIWACLECGHSQSKWSGMCPSCEEWNTIKKEVVFDKKPFSSQEKKKPKRIREISTCDFERLKTGIEEFDRIMGKGVVKGSLNLIGGNPGIGKSTLLLQVAGAFAKKGNTVLYICGEESQEQTSLRAKRIGIDEENLFLFHETSLEVIRSEIEAIKPQILIIDSVQIVYKNDIPSAPGSVTQVREVALECMHISKGSAITTFLIGHVTKSGDLAGPRVLEHIVDAVLEFEGDRHHGFRLLRSLKNRFGSTDDMAIFQMAEKGLMEVRDPSRILLEERARSTSGCAIVPALEGVRSFLIEVQALVSSSVFPTPTRKSSGLDPNRLSLLLAVLEKRVGYRLYQSDVFVSLAGGMKIIEPALDLGIVIAVASSFSNRALDSKLLVIGEVGLSGEVRSVSRIESRLKEGIHMGFERCILPKKNLRGLPKEIMSKMELLGVDFVDEAIQYAIN